MVRLAVWVCVKEDGMCEENGKCGNELIVALYNYVAGGWEAVHTTLLSNVALNNPCRTCYVILQCPL